MGRGRRGKGCSGVEERGYPSVSGEAAATIDRPGGAEEAQTVDQPKWVALGHPSYVWRSGQDRRLSLIRGYAQLDNRRILDVGCGIGTYVRKFREFSPQVYGVDIDPDKVGEASRTLPNIMMAPAEVLPFADDQFDLVLLHEVIEHVDDDVRAVAEAVRVARPGGRVIIFAPNRHYPFETHGAYFGGRYVFGLIPLVNYLPDEMRKRFCPHVRAYTRGDLQRLCRELPVQIVAHSCVYPGFDNIAARSRLLAGVMRRVLYSLEHTRLHAFGLSHFMVIEKRTP